MLGKGKFTVQYGHDALQVCGGSLFTYGEYLNAKIAAAPFFFTYGKVWARAPGRDPPPDEPDWPNKWPANQPPKRKRRYSKLKTERRRVNSVRDPGVDRPASDRGSPI